MLQNAVEDQSVKLLAVTWLFCGIGIFFVILRFYSRLTITRELWWDDFFIILSLANDIGMCVCRTIYGVNEYARHKIDLSPIQIETADKLSWISFGLAIAAHSSGRLSVAFLLYKIQPPSLWRTRVLQFLMLMIGLTAFAGILITYLQCSPPWALWESSLVTSGQAVCLNLIDYVYVVIGFASFWSFSDFALATIPVTMIWNLQLSIKRKLLFSGLLGLGYFAGVCAAVKVYYLTVLLRTDDSTWINVTLFLWDTIEINVIISAACIAIFHPLAMRLLHRRSQHEKFSASFEGSSQDEPRTRIPAMFRGFRLNRCAGAEFDRYTRRTGLSRGQYTVYGVSSLGKGRPYQNGTSAVYLSGDLPSLTAEARKFEQYLSREVGNSEPTHRFDEEGYV